MFCLQKLLTVSPFPPAALLLSSVLWTDPTPQWSSFVLAIALADTPYRLLTEPPGPPRYPTCLCVRYAVLSDSGMFPQSRLCDCFLLVTLRGIRPPHTIDFITELYHFTLSHYGVPAPCPTLKHHRWPLALQGLGSGGLLVLTGSDSHRLDI